MLFRSHKVQLMCSCKSKEITGEGVRVEKNDGSEVFVPADTVIMSVGYNSHVPSIFEQMKDIAPVQTVGDADHVSNLLSAINDGYDLALTL